MSVSGEKMNAHVSIFFRQNSVRELTSSGMQAKRKHKPFPDKGE
jgi:hypothetical protein